jgi:integrase
MATIQKRGNAYKINVSCGYDVRGKQVRQTMTYKPEANMTDSQIKKELTRQAVLFEENCKQGQSTSAIKFEEFSRQWFEEVAVLKLKERTLQNYNNLEKRIYKAIGHMKMNKITPRDIQKFILEMHEGSRLDRYKNGNLSAKTIKNHVALISTIFEHAIKMQVVTFNPCKAVTLPKDTAKEREVYSIEEVKEILLALHQEDNKNLQFVTYFTLAIFTGFRRGELLGLEWQDFNFNRNTISVHRTSNYTVKKGVFVDTPKTKTSYRTLKLPPEIMAFMEMYRQYQQEYIESIGDKWVGDNRLFVKWNGEPMFPNSPSLYFERFCKRHGFRYLPGHSLRHFNATAMIYAGVDIKAVQISLGHSTAQTTLTCYVHAFQASQAQAMDKIVGVLGLPCEMTERVEAFLGK